MLHNEGTIVGSLSMTISKTLMKFERSNAFLKASRSRPHYVEPDIANGVRLARASWPSIRELRTASWEDISRPV